VQRLVVDLAAGQRHNVINSVALAVLPATAARLLGLVDAAGLGGHFAVVGLGRVGER